jgi:dephospho-CoA kinase
VVFIDVPLQARRQRATARGMTEDDWARREAAQAPLADKRAAADTIVDNSGSLKALEQQIDQLVTSGSLGPRH